jgi:hypothetical protein
MVPRLAIVLLMVAFGVEAKGEEWTPSGEFSRLGGIEVGVVGSAVGQAELTAEDGRHSVSSDRVLRVKLRIRNLSNTQQVDYGGWGFKGVGFVGQFDARLKDDVGNIYRPIGFADAKPLGQIEETTLPAGGFAEDVLLFEMPRPNAKELLLTLPGQRIGAASDFRFAVPTASITHEAPIATVPETRPAPMSEPVPKPSETKPAPIPFSEPDEPTEPESQLTKQEIEEEFARQKSENAAGWFTGFSITMGLIFTLGVALYFLPMAVAFLRSHPNAASIMVINIFLGWTFLGWVAALAMAVSAVEIHATIEERAPRQRSDWRRD